MEESVALDSSKQKQFVKSVKGIKKLIKKKDTKGVSVKISAAKVKDGKVQKKKRAPRGLVYLGHIPHGFYEHEMTQYFKQFGVVTNARVIRSKRTGNSKGFAFVEFKEPAVAEIVAETMNNYLMGKRLIKAAYIPPEKQKKNAKRMFWSSSFNPGSEARLKMKKAYNANKDEQGDLKKARKLISNISKTKKKLNALGINYDFFTPVDVPESLVQLVTPADIKEEKKIKDSKENPKLNKDKKVKEEKTKIQINTTQQEQNKKGKKKQVPVKVEEKPAVEIKKAKIAVENKKVKPSMKVKETKPVVDAKKASKVVKVDKKQQEQKDKKLKDAGVKPVENFIKIQQESDDDSDSSANFDSDEFEKMLGDGDSDNSEGDEDTEGSDEDEDDSEEDSNEEVPKLVPARLPTPVKPVKKEEKKKQVQKNHEKSLPERKQKAGQNSVPTKTKTSKFENKNTQKLARKQFKKKK